MYFHDYKTALLSPGNDTKIADDLSSLEHKIDTHRSKGISVPSATNLPTDVHYLESLYYDHTSLGRVVIEEVSIKDYHQIKSNPKLSPMQSRPIYYRSSSASSVIKVEPFPTGFAVKCDYIKRPTDPRWGYVVVNEKALYNANTTVGFELHASEESTLTNKILELAGIVINKPGLSEVILRNEAVKEANENK